MRTARMILLAVMMVFTGTLFADGAGCKKGGQGCSGECSGGKGMKSGKMKMLKALDLDDNQKAQIKDLREANMKKMKEARAAMCEARKALMEAADSEDVNEETIKELSAKVADSVAVMALNKAQMKKDVKALLTDEQKEKFEKLHSEMKSCKGKGSCGKKGKKNRGKNGKKGCGKGNKKGCEDCDK